ncbi:adenylosuccinate lyase [Alphaproteobacteria bacterium KMM 3653]|uniref:Adenylosuccinate lyase n=1 Tax=Harenicola maris TaxID=2841044 RepID=A0AAP2CRA9_9RHOB|nr:adenylosuccinate lyase [Harenicola maris]
MKTKTVLAALALTLAPTLALAMGCGSEHSQEASISCADGTTYDADAGKCVASTS